MNLNPTLAAANGNRITLVSADPEEVCFHYPIEVCSDLVKYFITTIGQ